MFANLLFLILILLIINFSPDLQIDGWAESPWVAFGASMLLYIITLGIIALQNQYLLKRWKNRYARLAILANIELLIFFIISTFFLASQRIWLENPGLKNFQIVPTLFTLLLYFIGLAVLYHTTRGGHHSKNHVSRNLRFLIPFAIPFIVFTIITDIAWNIPNEQLHQFLTSTDTTWKEDTLTALFTLCIMAILMIFLPILIQSIWQCKPLKNSELLNRLEKLCQRSNFKHAGMKEWTIMSHMPTAAIIGIVPKFRYVMFTHSLLEQLTPVETEAVLAHEIGHSRHKHLLIYPIIIMGLVVLTGIVTNFISEPLAARFDEFNRQNPSSLWESIYLFTNFVIYALLVAIYFRLVFGYFSRLFERQADLYVFEVGTPPEAMYDALDRIGTITGNSHRIPSWHHYSIQQRMDCLKKAMEDPSLISQHHRRVRYSLIVYTILLVIAIVILIDPALITPFF